MAATSHDFWLNFLTPPVWKGLHMALYGAYGLAVMHVALGIMQYEYTWLIPAMLIGGFGGVNVKFYEKVSSSSSILGNSQYTQFFGSSNHFQVKGGVAAQFFATEHVFIKPEFDIRYVTNFNQFKRNMVPGFMVWVGYSFGDRQ